MRELLRALAVLAEPPESDATARVARALELPDQPAAWEYTSLFIEQLYPYASVYLGDEGKLGGEARDRVAGFWRALGQVPPAEPDHLSVLLGLLARLEELEEESEGARAQAWRRARAALYSEHLVSWLVPWLARLREIAPPTYRSWGELLAEALAATTHALRLPPDLPVALRAAPELPAPDDVGGERFVDALLAPVRSGLILVRDDLARAAGQLGLALRVGERRWVLGALLQQDPEQTLRWLAEEARRQADALETSRADPVRSFWSLRARRTAEVLVRAAL